MSDTPVPELPKKRETTLVALRQRRERTIETLCEHFARDHLETNELVELIDRAHAATTVAELDALLQDLPALATPGAVVATEGAPLPTGSGSRREHQPLVAVLSGLERKGRWTPAKQLYGVAFMGGIALDFREANMPAGYTDLYVLAWMGGIEIIVPPGLQVVSDGMGIMGGFEHGGNERETVDLSQPVLRIRGAAIMGGVEILAAEKGGAQPQGALGPAPRSLAAGGKRGQREEQRRLRHDSRHRPARGIDPDEQWLDEP